MEAYNFDAARADLEKLSDRPVCETLEVSYALYPKVIRDYLAYQDDHGDTSVLDSETFFYGLAEEREIRVDLEPGKSLIIQRRAFSELRDDGTRQVYFNLNGQPRSAIVEDIAASIGKEKRRRADATDDNHLGAPMPGTMTSVLVQPGQEVKEGEVLAVVEAMKLETNMRAPRACTISEVLARATDKVDAGDLIFVLS